MLSRANPTAGLLLAISVALVGCQNEDKASDTSVTKMDLKPDKVNESDISFVRELRTLHETTVALSAIGQLRATDSRVKDLADVMNQVYIDEMKLIDNWLIEWGATPKESVPQADTGAVLSSLEGVPQGAVFDRKFLELLINQLGRYIPIARQELEAGSTINALQLAERIVEEQPGEIEEMQGLLSELP